MQKYVTRIKDQIKTGKLVIAKCIQYYTKYRICEIADVNIHYTVISRIAITLEKWNDSIFAYWSCANDACVHCQLSVHPKIFNFDVINRCYRKYIWIYWSFFFLIEIFRKFLQLWLELEFDSSISSRKSFSTPVFHARIDSRYRDDKIQMILLIQIRSTN